MSIENVENCQGVINNIFDENNINLNELNDIDFLTVIKYSQDILALMVNHWIETDKKDWKDENIIPAIKNVLSFDRSISPELFNDIKEFINQHMFFDITGYKTLEDFNNARGGIILSNGYYFFKDAYNYITTEDLNDYEIIWIRSCDDEQSITITKESYNLITFNYL